MSSQGQISQSNNKEKEIYFIILTQSEKKVDLDWEFSSSELAPSRIYKNVIKKGKDSSIEENVFKLIIKENEKEKEIENGKEKVKKKKKKYKIEYIQGDDAYDILFSTNDNSFVYDTELKKGNKYLDNIVKEDIDQTIILYHNKLDIFQEALKQNNEINKINQLYKETIDVYEKKKKFSLLITLFLKIYDTNKDLCIKLMDVFKKINGKENLDKNEDLAEYLETFKQIYSDADNIKQENGYDSIKFYGILFCYLSHYDMNEFPNTIKKFYEGNNDIVFEILTIYNSHFKNLNQDMNFYNDFIRYLIKEKKEANLLEIALNYIDDIETFIYVINSNKTDIIKNYDEFRNKPIRLSSNLKLIKKADKEKKDKKEIDNIINLIKEIIKYSSDNKILTIYLQSEFWIYLVKQYNHSNLENISNCYRLREIYIEYYKLIISLYENTTNESEKEIQKDIIKYYYRDEFAFVLNNNIKKFLEEQNDNLYDQEKIGIIEKYNPYYSNKDESDIERYKNNRETEIFNNLNFKNPTLAFKETFIKLNFEKMFKENIVEFINKIVSKIVDISTFKTVMELINLDRIKNRKKDFYSLLKYKYETIIKNQIQNIKEESELNNAINILSEFISRIFLEENNNDFLEEKIGELDDKIKKLIYNELMRTYNDKKYQKMKEYIFEIFLKKIEDIDSIIKLIDSLKEDDKKDFSIELMKRCEFTKDEYYSNKENKKIKILCSLNEKGVLNINYNSKIEYILDEIRKDLECKSITKKNLEEFLNINEMNDNNKNEEGNKEIKKEDIQEKQKEENKKEIKEKSEDEKQKELKNDKNGENKKTITEQKLELLKLILPDYDSKKNYGDLKKLINDTNGLIKKLNYIKNSLIIFHQKTYRKQINEISIIIEDMEKKKINEFDIPTMRETRDKLMADLMTLCNDINKVKDFLLFKKLFEKAQGKNQEERFNDASNKLKTLKTNFTDNNIEKIFENFFMGEGNNKKEVNILEIFKIIKNDLSKKDESVSDKFIEQMADYFGIKKENKKDLSILIKSKRYEMVVKSINYFFKNFKNKEIILSKDIELSEMKLDKLKKKLDKLKEYNIYDYNIKPEESYFYKIFTSFYEKKEAIDFLISKVEIGIDNLIEKLDPTTRSLSIKDIKDAIDCLLQIKEIMNKNDSDIINYFKFLDENTINKFVNYSKHYPSIIELDRKNEKDIFEEIYIIIKDASLIFKLDNEYFYYKNEGDEKIEKKIEELIDLKNKINIQSSDGEENNKEKDPYQEKCKKLKFFKDKINDIEVIYDKMKILRTKGYNIPILINISIKYPEIIYKYNKDDEEKNFEDIKNYLFTIKNDYENRLNIIYQNEKYLRFLYGKLFRKIKLHQEGNCEVLEIIKYILNKTDYKDKITDGDTYNKKIGEDFENDYKDYTIQIFDNMSKYIISLFEKNDLDYEKHYNNILIQEKNKYRGFYIKKCKIISMEEYIIYLFKEKLNKLPIAQNILICSNETSIEELQSFLYRAILCEHNTLFIIEILKSFTNFQHNRMYSYIDKLLTYKFENSENKNKNKLNTRDYLNTCIYFIYKELEDEDAFKSELNKYLFQPEETNEIEKGKEDDIKNKTKLNDLNISEISKDQNESMFYEPDDIKLKNIKENIKVFSSDVCGLGKSFQINKLKKDNEIYYHFPLGGLLTKKVIYDKLSKLLQKIKDDAKIRKDELKKKESKKDGEEQKDDKNKKDEKEQKNDENSEFDNVVIHLDLIESKETSLINEFLFSFLITNFYTNNEDIIYIPNNIKIYVEIPNSFENYLEKFGILNVFPIENIQLGKLHELELDENTRNIFKKMIGKYENKEIEEFIKKEIGIKEYSYHQIQTFIKLFISQFSVLNSEIKFKNSQQKDITDECISYFSKSTKYFIDGGFAKLIMEKKNNIKDKIDLCLDAYNNDLNGKSFKTPLIYIDKETKQCKFEILPEIIEEEKIYSKIIKNINKEVDITYLIDATGSMYGEIKAANDHVMKIFDKLKNKYKNYDFRFGAVFYRDQVDSKGDKNEYFPITNNMEELKKNISTIKAYGGRDIAEDWVTGYNLALNNMNWRNGIKLIIHIADAGAHGTEFTKGDKHTKEGPKLIPLIQKCVQNNINIIGFKITKEPERSFNKISEVYNKYKISEDYNKYKESNKCNGDNCQFIEIYEFDRGEGEKQDIISENFQKLVIEAANQVVNPSYKFLKRLKQILHLENDLENDIGNKKSLMSILKIGIDNYVITEDNYKKMVLLIYRIKANVPVIIMGETGCGKTSLIVKLSHIVNNGEEGLVEIINIHPGIKDNEIIDRMKKINEKVKKNNKELWIFFDEINTCLSLSLLTEIFINRTFDGEKLDDNIRLIGACNPYRRRKLTAEKCGLSREDEIEDNLVYKVEQLPQSLLFYVFSFGSLKDEDEKKYIKKIFDKNEEELHNLTTEAISKCHIFLRKTFEDPSIVSLREIARFTKCVEFFQDYFLKKYNQKKNDIDDETKKLYKIKSIICSIYLCYYIRLIDDQKRGSFNTELQQTLLEIVNVYSEEKNDKNNKANNLFDKIKYEKLKKEIMESNIENFSDLLKIEEEFLLSKVEKNKGIGENELLKENLFLLFLSVVTKIPLTIVGKPGTGKSLSAQLIYNSMRGEYSKNDFFKKYPPIIQIYFQGSESTTPEDITELFDKADGLYKNYIKIKNSNDIVPIYMILFDELGLAERAPTNPLKVLHTKLEYDGKTEGVCFIGISNYSLDAAKVNRTLSLSVPNLEEKIDQLKATAKSIVASISEDISKERSKLVIFNILSRSYHLYKRYLIFIKKLMALKKFIENHKEFKGKDFKEIEIQPDFKKELKQEKNIKTEFHGNRDFYNIIKGVAIEGSKLNNILIEKDIIPIINSFIERNFGGITYEIDIDFSIQINDKKEEMAKLKEILKGKISNKKNNNKEKDKGVTSVYLFKKIYNEACSDENYKNENENIKGDNYKIKDENVNKYDLNKCIIDNINDNNSRYLLLEIRSNLAPLINRIISTQNPERKDIDFINGSPFLDDNNNEYKIKKVGDIQNRASIQNKLIILQNLEPIQPYLYDLYNMNYKIIDEQKYVRICLDNFSEDLTPVSDSFRTIILVEQEFVNSVDMAFLNRLEKMQISFNDLLNDEQKNLKDEIIKEINLADEIKDRDKKLNYDLNQFLINCRKQDIGVLTYNSYLENNNAINKNEIKEKIYKKISDILPQDIIVNLKDTNPIRQKYNSERRYRNFNEYIQDLEIVKKNNNKNNYKISIIYTFSSILNTIEGYNKVEQIMISEIKTEDKLKINIDDIKNKNKLNDDDNKHIILFNFEQNNSNKLQFVSDYINTNCDKDGYNYIFIIHLQRSLTNEHKTKKEKIIYSIPNIYPNINQLFIDNLRGSEITLKDLLTKNIKEIMFNAFKNLDNEFNEILVNFVFKEMQEKTKIFKNSTTTIFSSFLDEKYNEKNIKVNLSQEQYSDEIKKYMQSDQEFKNELIKKAKELIEMDKDKKLIEIGKDKELTCQDLINDMFDKNCIGKNNIDIVSCILDYIKDNIFKKYLQYIFKVLEHNNFLTTLMEISKDKNTKLDPNDRNARNDKCNKIILKELKNKFLKEIKIENPDIYEPKFLFNYKIPGFYNFYKDLSNYLYKNIVTEFYNNEKKLRDYSGEKPDGAINKFHDNEKKLLDKVLKKINENILYDSLINKITPDVILKDYIRFYLEKYIGSYSEDFYEIIKLLLSLRYPDKNEIIKDNESIPINIVILKIIWIESNINYIENILKSFSIGKDIINDKVDLDYNQMISDIIYYDSDIPISYIVDTERNPEFAKEVNECFYIVLAGLCLSITDKIKLDELTIKDYSGRLKKINDMVQTLTHDLNMYLNELYIIDELIKIIDYELDKGIENIKNIEQIKNYLVENSKIIQKNNSTDKMSQLRVNFKNLNDKLKEEKDEKFKNKYYSTLKYIYSQEIKKIKEDSYRAAILGILMEEKDVIKISNDIFQKLLEIYVDKEYFSSTREDLLNNKKNYDIINVINKYLSDNTKDYYLSLSETIIYFFEKNSLTYFEYILKEEEQSLSEEPLEIFEECNIFLSELQKSAIKFHEKCYRITKLFCIGYIKSFCYTFIKMHDKTDFVPENIINKINELGSQENESDEIKNEIKMVKLYIYKIIYNLCNKQMHIFLNDNTKSKYKLNKYDGFENFINFENNEQLINYYKISDKDNYKDIYDKLVLYQKDGYKNEIEKEDININENNFDDFYVAAYNLILSKLKQKDFEIDDSYINFYQNIIKPLYEKNDDDDKILVLLQFLFDKDQYSDIKKAYEINYEEIDILLYGYRYCLNEMSIEHEDKNKEYIYSYLYEDNSDFNEKFYPGSDTKQEEPYYDLYNKIENHFKENPKQGCYVCLCTKGYYHSVRSGFPGYSEIKLNCPNCGKKIGANEKYEEVKSLDDDKIKLHKVYETVNRENYVRIFKDKDEIDKLNKANIEKLSKIHSMTKEEFKKKYIIPLYNREKGLNEIDENTFKKDNKKIRNLSQLSYRLLNYILYCHLFFAKLSTNSEKFDNYLPKGMSWFNTIKECFILLKKELEKKGIKEIDIFMNYIFKDLFEILHDEECIKNFEKLIEFEDKIDKLIQGKFDDVKKEIDKFKKFEKDSIKNKESGIALLKEIYNKKDYGNKNYPFYEYFYYNDYLDKKRISDMLEHKDKNEYIILSKYLELENQKKKGDKKDHKDKYSLDKLIIFNKVLNLFNDKYSNQITREYAEKTIIKDSDIYKINTDIEKDEEGKEDKKDEEGKEDKKEKEDKEGKEKEDKEDKKKKKHHHKKELNNKELIDEFIKLYNDFNLEENGKKIELNVDKNCICDFLLIDDNKYGKTYKKIYDIFTEKQNKELENLLDKKINLGIFNDKCKNSISIQQIKEKEIFKFNIGKKKFNFNEVIFNASYRKIIDTQNYENYNEYEINLYLAEEEMTDILLKNKKLVKNEIIQFNYNNEVFSNEIKDLISNFKYDRENLGIDDKIIFYDYVNINQGNNGIYIKIINDFITLIEYINKNNDKKINKETKISEIEIVKKMQNISQDFQSIFIPKSDNNKVENSQQNNIKDNKANLIVNKLPNMLDYFLKIIFTYIKKDIEQYQVKKEEKEKGNSDEKSIKNLDEKLIKSLDEIFNKNDMIIKKESLASAIRIFISLVLYREKVNDKDRKIKSNKKNIIDYLKAKDLWEPYLYNNSNKNRFEENLERLKSLNIKIQEILWLYYYLIDYKDEGFENDVKAYKKQIKDKEEKERKEREKREEEERERERKNQKGPQLTKPKKEKKDRFGKVTRKKSSSDSDSGSDSDSN